VAEERGASTVKAAHTTTTLSNRRPVRLQVSRSVPVVLMAKGFASVDELEAALQEYITGLPEGQADDPALPSPLDYTELKFNGPSAPSPPPASAARTRATNPAPCIPLTHSRGPPPTALISSATVTSTHLPPAHPTHPHLQGRPDLVDGLMAFGGYIKVSVSRPHPPLRHDSDPTHAHAPPAHLRPSAARACILTRCHAVGRLAGCPPPPTTTASLT
jgi:hypothetical protein